MGGRMIRYRKSEIDAWLAAGADFHPSEPPVAAGPIRRS
jgi:hypothetical protein